MSVTKNGQHAFALLQGTYDSQATAGIAHKFKDVNDMGLAAANRGWEPET